MIEVLWRSDAPLAVREVRERLDTSKPPAYTTVMTVLDDLHRKSWTDRERDGRAYHPTRSRMALRRRTSTGRTPRR